MAATARQPPLFSLPALALVPRRPARKLPKFLDEHELRALLAAAEASGPRDYALIVVLAYAGLRVSEACALRWGHVEGGRLFVECGKGGKQRLVPMHARVAAALDALGRIFTKLRPGHDDFVFPGGCGGRLGSRGAERIVMRLCAKAALAREKGHPHALRHTFATRVLRSDGNILKVQRLLGHTSVATTQIYTHLIYDDLAEAVAGLE